MSTEWLKLTTKPQIYGSLFNNESFADVKFIFPQRGDTIPKILYSHSILLSELSPVFNNLFYDSNGTRPINDFYKLVITESTYSHFSEFIKYFYNLEGKHFAIKPHNCDRSNNLYCLLKLAREYDFKLLEDLILSYFDKHLKRTINFNTVVNTLLISNLRCDRYRKTFTRSVTFIKRNYYKFLRMNLASELDYEGLEFLLRFNEVDYRTKEIDIYQAVIGWVEKQNKFDYITANYRYVLGEKLLKLIRFPTMSNVQFKKVIAICSPKLLEDDEIRKLYSYISNVSYEQVNEMVDLCGYNHVARNHIKRWRDYKFC